MRLKTQVVAPPQDNVKEDEMGRRLPSTAKNGNAYRVWRKNQKERYHQKDLDVDGKIILQRILKI
jgi:hypothetical protein